eukprot:3412397-Rhodomonas_salina.4
MCACSCFVLVFRVAWQAAVLVTNPHQQVPERVYEEWRRVFSEAGFDEVPVIATHSDVVRVFGPQVIPMTTTTTMIVVIAVFSVVVVVVVVAVAVVVVVVVLVSTLPRRNPVLNMM